MDNPRFTAQLFNGFSNVYDLSLTLFTFGLDSIWKRRLLHRLGPIRDCRVLDIATGTGLLAIRLARMVGLHGSVVGVDLARSMIAQAKRKVTAAHLHLLEAMAEHLPFADHSFDHISACYLQKYCRQDTFLCEVQRLLKPNGTAVLYDFSLPSGIGGLIPRLYVSKVLALLAVLVSPIHRGLSRLLAFLPGKIAASRWHESIGTAAAKSQLQLVSLEPLPSGAAIMVTLTPLQAANRRSSQPTPVFAFPAPNSSP